MGIHYICHLMNLLRFDCYKCHCEHLCMFVRKHSFLSLRYLAVELLSHMIPVFNFEQLPTFPTVLPSCEQHRTVPSTLAMVSMFYYSHCSLCEVVSHWDLICISVITHDVRHSVTCLFDIYIYISLSLQSDILFQRNFMDSANSFSQIISNIYFLL